MNRPRRKRGGAYNFPALRRREIERHARDVWWAHTEESGRWIVGWRWHNEQNSRDPAGALILAAKRMGGSLTEAGAERILETADALPRCCTADKLGKFLGVTYAQRQKLAIPPRASSFRAVRFAMASGRDQHRPAARPQE